MFYAFYNYIFCSFFSTQVAISLQMSCIFIVFDAQLRLQYLVFCVCPSSYTFTSTTRRHHFPHTSQWKVWWYSEDPCLNHQECLEIPPNVLLDFTANRSSGLTFRGLSKVTGDLAQTASHLFGPLWLLRNRKRNQVGIRKTSSTS